METVFPERDIMATQSDTTTTRPVKVSPPPHWKALDESSLLYGSIESYGK
jgi:hypothetical protein